MIPAPTPVERGVATSADGVRIAWYRYGAGPSPILFVPTWNIVDARVVGHQVAALAPLATVVTYDPRGAGRSDRPDSGYDFPFHAADALAVLDALAFERASVVTASRGMGAVALLATQQPERVDRIAAIAPYMQLEPEPARPDPASLESWRTDWAGFMVPFMRAVFSEADSDEVIEQMTAIGMEATPDAVIAGELETDWTAPARALASVSCPTLIIHGDADVTMPLSLVEAITRAIPGARLELVSGGGHRPDIRSPERVNPLLIAFLMAGGARRAGVPLPPRRPRPTRRR